ncbi:hypothetical protein [Marinobacter sp. tcs-11]|uniref:hypothetical protein n=1 Tax=Marinobacter sp. tcs-11 TaxID=1742860 RepID=UPI00258114A1|nr:hypothetical protein [Marinobacter sp. tcs-11]
MCRIDAPYGNRSLDEKSDPTERFLQALDESQIDGQSHSLLTKHFSDNWNRIFGSATDLEKVLSAAQHETSDQKKCAAILSSGRLAQKLTMQLLNKHPIMNQRNEVADHGSEVFLFAQEIAQTLFSASPYSLYSALKNVGTTASLTVSFDWFVTALYGEEFCFSPTLFDDPALVAEDESTRNDILWDFFNTMSQYEDGYRSDLASMCGLQIKNLVSLASLQLHEGPPNLGSSKFLQGIRFLKAWVASDAAAGRLASINEGAFQKLGFEWSNFDSTLRSFDSSDYAQLDVSQATVWLDKTRIQFWEALCLHMNLTSADDQQIEQWASLLNLCFTSLSIRYSEVLTKSVEEREIRENEYLKHICSELTDYQLKAWIRWSIREDIRAALRLAERTPLAREFCGNESRKWWATEYSAIWKAQLEDELSNLDIETKLTVLSGALCSLPDEAAVREYRDWWDDLFEQLIQDPDFPPALMPQWSISAADRLDNGLVLPYIDKSVGVLRGELSNGAQPHPHKQLEELLRKLSFLKPSKALRHRLMLMRSSTKPISDESVSRFNPMNSENSIDWYLPLREAAWDRLAKRTNLGSPLSREEYEQAALECYESFALELVEFCLSRLRLRKGQKPKDGKYDEDQITERSPIWRQGYLKALLELGLDPNGKAHKTVYFTKQFDPDESVRAVAQECYRAVRREAKKNRSIQDFKRGLIAAEWWLLMSQRLELNLEINHGEALKTRRNLLRNP